jgi:hypothetical protein
MDLVTIPGDFEALTLLEGCRLSAPLDIWPGLGIWPIADPRHRLGIAAVMDEILANAGWNIQIGTSDWLRGETANLPLALVQLVLPVDNVDDARIQSRVFVDLVIAVLALKRGAAATPLVTVLRRRGGGPDQSEFTIESRAPLYRGNLLGGVISGEDPADFATALSAGMNPLVRLWLDARRDLATERNPEFAVHRWWNLVEALASSREREVHPVTDFDGTPISWPGTRKSFDTTRQAGLVFMHVREMFEQRQIHEGSFVAHSDNLWDFVVAWCGYRNAVAHHGTFDPADRRQERWWWYEQTTQAYKWAKTKPGGFLREVMKLGDLVLNAEIERYPS